MKGERWLLGVGECLVGLAARRLPAAVRDERRREWVAELPVILGDPEAKPAAVRAARMLWFAADTVRGAARVQLRALGPARARHRGTHRGPASVGALVKDARWLGVGVGLLTMLAPLLAVGAYIDYRIVVSENLMSYLTLVLTCLAFLAARRFLWRRPAGAYGWHCAGLVAAATGYLLATLV